MNTLLAIYIIENFAIFIFPFSYNFNEINCKNKKTFNYGYNIFGIYFNLYHFKINKIMKVEVSNGELLDKLSILELKLLHIKDKK